MWRFFLLLSISIPTIYTQDQENNSSGCNEAILGEKTFFRVDFDHE